MVDFFLLRFIPFGRAPHGRANARFGELIDTACPDDQALLTPIREFHTPKTQSVPIAQLESVRFVEGQKFLVTRSSGAIEALLRCY